MTTPLDPLAAVTHPDPYPYYAALVALQPFHYDERLKLWIAAGANVVTEVLESDLCRVRPAAEPVPPHLRDGAAAGVFGRLVRMTDGAQRDALKRALLSALSAVPPSAVAACAVETIRQLRDEIPAAPDSWLFDLPVRSMAALLGVPPERQAHAAAWTGDFVRALLPAATPEQIARGEAATQGLLALLQSCKGSGLLRAIDEATHGCDADAVLANALGLLMQTHDATAALLGNALVVLQRQPALRAALRTDPDLLPEFIQEVLRFDAPVQNTRRFVAEDGEAAGQHLRAGDTILVLLAAANRDPAANADPHSFIVERPARRILGFGHGRHACAGPDIAATIAAAGIQYWVNDDLALPQAIGYRPSANARIPYFSPDDKKRMP